MKKTNKKKEHKLLPFHTILDATEGDPLAMEKVLKHFEGYMMLFVKLPTSYFPIFSQIKRRYSINDSDA